MSAENAKLQNLLQRADQLTDDQHYLEAVDALKEYPNQLNADILWRETRALYKLTLMDIGKTGKEKIIREGYDLIVKALEIDPNNYGCHKWFAILLNARSELDGTRAHISELRNVKKHIEKAIELNPDDATNWHLLGDFVLGLAEMPWYKRAIVSAIFATPPTGTYEEALDNFLIAEYKKPGFYSLNLLFIGKCYNYLGDKEKAKEFLTKASNVLIRNEDDKKCKEEAATLLKTI